MTAVSDSTLGRARPRVDTAPSEAAQITSSRAGAILVDAGGTVAHYWPNVGLHFACASELTMLYDAWVARVGRVERPVDAVIKQLLVNLAETVTLGTDGRDAFTRMSALAALAYQVANPVSTEPAAATKPALETLDADIRAFARMIAPETQPG